MVREHNWKAFLANKWLPATYTCKEDYVHRFYAAVKETLVNQVPISLPKAALPLSSSAVKRYEVSGHEIIHVQKEGSWLKFSFNSV